MNERKTQELCLDRQPISDGGWYCSLRKNHDGDEHVAYEGHQRGRWPRAKWQVDPHAPKPTSFRVWWIPQVPMSNPFHVVCPDLETAVSILETLAQYDLYQFANNIKPDFSNAGGIEQLVGGEWEHVDEDEYDDLLDRTRVAQPDLVVMADG